MSGTTMVVFIVAIAVGASVLTKIVHGIANASAQRQANKEEFREIRDAISQIQADIDEIKETLADIVITLHNPK